MPDAGRYLADLQATDEQTYNELLDERSTPWGGSPKQRPVQCVIHTLAILFRAMEEPNASGGRPWGQVGLTEREVKLWFARNEQVLKLKTEEKMKTGR